MESPIWRRLLFSLSFFHTAVQERKRFGPQAWAVPYEFNTSDFMASLRRHGLRFFRVLLKECVLSFNLQASLSFIERNLSHRAHTGALSPSDVPWPALQFMTGDIHYGGRVTDEMDRVVLTALTQRWISDRIMTATASLKPDVIVDAALEAFSYAIPDFSDIAQYRTFVEGFPAEDSPELLGLHPNVAIASRMRASTDMLNTLSKCQTVRYFHFLPQARFAVLSGVTCASGAVSVNVSCRKCRWSD